GLRRAARPQPAAFEITELFRLGSFCVAERAAWCGASQARLTAIVALSAQKSPGTRPGLLPAASTGGGGMARRTRWKHATPSFVPSTFVAFARRDLARWHIKSCGTAAIRTEQVRVCAISYLQGGTPEKERT